MCEKQECKVVVMRVVSRLNIGGPTIHMKILTEGLDKRLFDTKLIVGSLSAHEGDMSYLITSSNRNYVEYIPSLQREIAPIKDLIAFWEIFKTINRMKPDIVHTHMAKAGAIGRVATVLYNLLFRNKIKLVHTFHGNVLEGYFNPALSYVFLMIERSIAKFTDAIIAISQTQKWELVEKFKVSDAEKIHTINLGFDLKPFADLNERRGRLREKIGVNDSCKLVGIVGRLVPIKNHYMFLDAAKTIIDNNQSDAIKFVVVGDGELRPQLESYASKLGIKSNVIFWGWERDIPIVYGGLDILALTSMNEGTPVSIIEAMASGVPVITTGVGGVKDLLGAYEKVQTESDGFTICERGILCPKNNPIALAKGIEFILSSESVEQGIRTEKSRKYVLDNYSDVRLIREIERLYLQLSAKPMANTLNSSC